MLTFSDAIYSSNIIIVNYTRFFKITYETFFRKSYGFQKKNLPASRAHFHRAQLAWLASLSAPRVII